MGASLCSAGNLHTTSLEYHDRQRRKWQATTKRTQTRGMWRARELPEGFLSDSTQ